MPRRYDPDTLTVFDLDTGESVLTVLVPDNGSFEEAHRTGYLMAAAEEIIAAARDAVAVIDPKVWTRVEWFHLADALRAAEPPR